MRNRQHSAGVAAALGLTTLFGGVSCLLGLAPAVHVPARTDPFTTSPGLSCGPAALIAACDSLGGPAPQSVRAVLAADTRAVQPVCTLLDLARWADRAGVNVLPLRLLPEQLDCLPPPFIAHLAPGHFAAVLRLDATTVEIRDQFGARRFPRADFNGRFSGAVLCLRASSCARNTFTPGADS